MNFMKPLDSPIKRFGFFVLITGALLTISGFVPIVQNNFELHGIYRDWLDAVRFKRGRLGPYWAAAIGTYLMIAGAFLSYLYDCTLSKLVAWIRHG